jgi:hypothetical protein
MDLPPRERVGPREQLTLTTTEREVDGWRVAAVIAGLRLAEWAVEALDEAARAAIGARVDATDRGTPRHGPPASAPAPSSTLKTLIPGPWVSLGAARDLEPMGGLPPEPEGPPEDLSDGFCDVMEGLEAVHRCGVVSLADGEAVANAADQLGHEATARWIRENPTLYARLFGGPEE